MVTYECYNLAGDGQSNTESGKPEASCKSVSVADRTHRMSSLNRHKPKLLMKVY